MFQGSKVPRFSDLNVELWNFGTVELWNLS